jgi:hypothetical protein
MISLKLRQAGERANHKRVHRQYVAESLQIRDDDARRSRWLTASRCDADDAERKAGRRGSATLAEDHKLNRLSIRNSNRAIITSERWTG